VRREEFISPFSGENWFTDVAELDRHFVATHENPRLPAHKRRFCAEEAAGRISDRLGAASPWSSNISDTLAFGNPPGPVGGGMCWLHSRLQRRFTYLANFRPTDERGRPLPRPSREEAEQIIHRLVHGMGVTEIPGFRNVFEFSQAYERELTSAIDGMGWRCFFGGPLLFNTSDCFARVGDESFPSTEDLRATMDQIYDRAFHQPGDVQFLRTRVQEHAFSGAARPLDRVMNPSAHSFLLVGIEPITRPGPHGPSLPGVREGYRMRVIDPNLPNIVQTVEYRYGDASLPIGTWNVVPRQHYEYDGDIPEMHRRIQEYCRAE
jgi:hypothetical protein